MEKTSTGLPENIAGLLCYIIFWPSGIVFLLLEQENKFVRFHAGQSIVTFGSITALMIVLSIFSFVPFFGVIFGIANWILGLLAFVLWIVLMVKAYQGIVYKLPWAGNLALGWCPPSRPCSAYTDGRGYTHGPCPDSPHS